MAYPPIKGQVLGIFREGVEIREHEDGSFTISIEDGIKKTDAVLAPEQVAELRTLLVPTSNPDPNRWVRRFTKENVHWHAGAEYNRMFIQCQESYLNHLVQARGHVFLNEALEQLGFPLVPIGQTVGWVNGQHIDFNLQHDRDDIVLAFNVDEDVWDKINWNSESSSE